MAKRKLRKRRSGHSNKFTKSLVLGALCVLGLTINQYSQYGYVDWHSRAYVALLDTFEQFLQEDSPVQTDAPATWEGRVTKITDGDTVKILATDWNEYTIRLYGIDTPERDQVHGTAAGNALREKIFLRKVSVSINDKDDYGRYVGTIYHDDRNINLEMVQEGHAWWYEYYAQGERHLRDAQASARENGIGLWAYQSPVPPWEWRRR